MIGRGYKEQDKRLAELLVKGSQLKRIARQMSIPTSKIYYRINRLKRMGVLSSRGYAVDFENMGYNITALIVARTRGPSAEMMLGGQDPIQAILETQMPGMMITLAASSENGTTIFVLAHFERVQAMDNFTTQLRETLEIDSIKKHLISSSFP